LTGFERFLDTFFKWELIVQYTPAILSGMVVTVLIGLAIVVTGLLLGLVFAVLRCYRSRILSWPIILFADIFRALPPLVLVLLVYFGLPNLGISLTGFTVLWLVLSLTLAAFAEEIFWAGITSVRKGQWDAARGSGLTATQALLHVILPQAVRITIPPLTNRTIAIIKNTALGTVIGVPEILNQATTAVSFAGNATPLTLGALAYLVLFLPVVTFGRWIEARFAWKRA
jgi:polar amino acid transport system permease protein